MSILGPLHVLNKHRFPWLSIESGPGFSCTMCTAEAGREKALDGQLFAVLLGVLGEGTEVPVPTRSGWICLWPSHLGSVYSLFSVKKGVGRATGSKGEGTKNMRKREPGQSPGVLPFQALTSFCLVLLTFFLSRVSHFESRLVML